MGGDAAGESCGSPRQCALIFRPTLVDALIRLVDAVRDEVGETRKLRRFLAFHAANPRIYELVERFALLAATHRRTRHYGIRMIWERVRWEVAIETVSSDDRKLNDAMHALYARLFLLHHPEHRGLFELRRLHPEGRRRAA